MIGNYILIALWYMLPAYVANSLPVFARRVNFLNYPIDFGKKWKGKPIFGSSKTFRGYFFGTIGAILVAMIQSYLSHYPGIQAISIFDYKNPLLIGICVGTGSLFGDSIKSFFKRRVGIKPGNTWLFFDQSDYILGALIFGSLITTITWQNALSIYLVSFLGHFLSVFIGYKLGIRKQPI